MKKMWIGTAMTLALMTSFGGTVAAHATGDDPTYGEPAAGQCYADSAKAAWTADSTSAAPVSCSTKHKLWVLAVATVPPDVSLDGPSAGLAQVIAATCQPAEKTALGDGGALWAGSAYEPFVFLPTTAQQAQGAHWLSCLEGIDAGHNQLVATTKHHPEKLKGHTPDRLRGCSTGKLAFTNCASNHAWRTAAVVKVNKKPTSANVASAGNKVCKKHVHGKKWVYRGRSQHSTTSFYIVCEKPDHH